MKYRHLFFDLDHTLWDFDANAKLTLQHIHENLELQKAGIDDFDLFYRSYLLHNEKLWEKYRNGHIKSDELRWKRMWNTLMEFRIADVDLAKKMGMQFLEMLPKRNLLFPDTVNTLSYLTNKGYKLHLITNGFEETQHTKLKNSGISQFFQQVITSEASNSIKPKKEIFEYALYKTKALVDECIMIGDSIEVDIIGAMNAGIDQVYVNHLGLECGIHPTYIVNSIKELEQIF
jgi:putative hydrolase of the HAD superfamily